MRTSSPFSRDRPSAALGERRRSVSPNNFSSYNRSHSSSNVKSQHLWSSLQDIELFPQQFSELLKHEDRNMNQFKKRIQREKAKVSHEFDAVKREIIHNIEDLKLSVQAELDRVYKIFMEKYAVFKGEILEIKRLRDEIENDLAMRKMTPSTQKFLNSHNSSQRGSNASSVQSNSELVRSMESGQSEIRKYHIINYIAELQKEKILPLNELSSQILILNEYDNGFFQSKEFTHIINNLKENFRDNLRYTYERKYDFIRDPDFLAGKDQRPVLDEVYEEPKSNSYAGMGGMPTRDASNSPRNFGKVKNSSSSLNLNQRANSGSSAVAVSQQVTSVDWAEDINLTYQGNLRAVQFSDIILCGIEVRKNQIAVGGKDGSLVVYDPSTGNKVSALKGHKSSICSLAMVNHEGLRCLASGSDHGCSSIIIWDIDSWGIRQKLEGHKAAVTCILDLGDGCHIASGSYDKRINVYNMHQNNIAYNLPTNKSSVTGMILSAQGSKMISCGLDNSLNVWQIVRNRQGFVDTMFLERIIQNNTMICSLVGSMLQDHLIYIGTKDGKIKLINIERGEAYKTLSCCNSAIIEMLVVERESKTDHPMVMCWPGKEEAIKVVNCETGKVGNVSIKGYIEFGCGVGPKSFILNTGKTFGMVSQSDARKQIGFYKLQYKQ